LKKQKSVRIEEREETDISQGPDKKRRKKGHKVVIDTREIDKLIYFTYLNV